MQAVCVLPTEFPINASNLNWAPITAALVILVALAAWFFPVIGAGAWYQGKAHTLRDANVVGTFQPGICMTIHISYWHRIWAPITAALETIAALAAWLLLMIGAGAWYRGKAHTLSQYLKTRSQQVPFVLLSDKASIGPKSVQYMHELRALTLAPVQLGEPLGHAATLRDDHDVVRDQAAIR